MAGRRGRRPGARTGWLKPCGNKFEAKFWCEERGFYADWIDAGGERHFYLYAGPQVMAITAGMIPDDRAGRVLDAIRRRRRELGPAWENCFSLQTNFYDAEKHSLMFRLNGTDETRFGETMNGGCLTSWNYYWIGALVKIGRIGEAVEVWRGLAGAFCRHFAPGGQQLLESFGPAEPDPDA